MGIVYIIIAALVSALIAGIGAWSITRSTFLARLKATEQMHAKEMENSERLAQQAQANYERALKEMKETVVASMTAETEKILKKREQELTDGTVALKNMTTGEQQTVIAEELKNILA